MSAWTSRAAAVAAAAALLVVVCACGMRLEPLRTTPTPTKTYSEAAVESAARGAVADVARTCARITSCGRQHDDARLRDPAACVDWWLQYVAVAGEKPLRDCVYNAHSCAHVDACMRPPQDERVRTACKAHGARTGTFCDGALLVTCNDDPAQSSVVDCATLGATCGESRGAGGLVTRACLSKQACPAEAPEARCDGPGAILTCSDGAVARVACPRGFRCDDVRDEGRATASCAPREDLRCATAGGRHCDGDTLVDCVAHGHFRAVGITECRARGLVCAGEGEAARCAVSRDATCPARGARCEGDVLVFCAAGMEARLACKDVGFAGCDPDAHGPEAACASAPSQARPAGAAPSAAGNDAGVARP